MQQLRRGAVLVTAFLLLAACGGDTPDIDPAAYTLRIQGQVGTVDVDLSLWLESVTPDAPQPTVTPPPTNTARPTATMVLPATATLTPTNTQEPIATDAPDATPTQEQTVIPTVPPGADKRCELKTNADALRVRADASLSATQTGLIYRGAVLTVRQFYHDGTYLWALHDAGWSAVWFGYDWWADGVEGSTETCIDVPGWPIEDGYPWVPPDPIVMRYWEGPAVKYGTHGFTDTNAALYTPFFPRLGGFKLVGGGVDFYRVIEANNPNVVTVHRPFGAYCPQYGTPAAAWLAQFEGEFMAMRGVVDFFEPTNECGHGYDDAISHQTDWIIEAVDWANARGLCLALYSFGVGNPADGSWPDAFIPALEYILDHPCKILTDGTRKLHAVAMHSYTEAGNLTGGLGWLWLHGAPDRRYWPALPPRLRVIPLLITEWGDAGLYARYVPESRNPIDCRVVADSVRWALDTYTGDYPDAIYHWTAGGFGQWYDAVGQCRAEIGAALGN